MAEITDFKYVAINPKLKDHLGELVYAEFSGRDKTSTLVTDEANGPTNPFQLKPEVLRALVYFAERIGVVTHRRQSGD